MVVLACWRNDKLAASQTMVLARWHNSKLAAGRTVVLALCVTTSQWRGR
jgi:hypothetical protein